VTTSFGRLDVPSTSELLLAWDARRPRTLQKELGWSELGGCRRRAGYRLAGTPPSNAGSSVQAVLGTAVHDAVAAISTEMGYDAETRVEFAGIPGHFDRVEGDEVVDVKTVGTDRWLEHVELHGPSQGDRWQVQGYAAALLLKGLDIRRVRIDYLARDTGREWSWRSPFRPLDVRDALAWLALVRDAPVEDLPRDYEPDGPFCRGCPFFVECWGRAVEDRDPRSVIYLEDPDLPKHARELFEVRAEIEQLKAREKRLRGVLDAVRSDEPSRINAGPIDVCFQRNGRGGLSLYLRPAAKVPSDDEA
jgi:stage V sporulation protein SpoVS